MSHIVCVQAEHSQGEKITELEYRAVVHRLEMVGDQRCVTQGTQPPLSTFGDKVSLWWASLPLPHNPPTPVS